MQEVKNTHINSTLALPKILAQSCQLLYHSIKYRFLNFDLHNLSTWSLTQAVGMCKCCLTNIGDARVKNRMLAIHGKEEPLERQTAGLDSCFDWWLVTGLPRFHHRKTDSNRKATCEESTSWPENGKLPSQTKYLWLNSRVCVTNQVNCYDSVIHSLSCDIMFLKED